jgi:GH15 family glucan-1,4-alpha-glucosidase
MIWEQEMDLYGRSIDIILQNQADSGAYVASPVFPQYAYCWLRDGSFIGYAMDRVGEHQSSRAFLSWVARVLHRHSAKVERVLEKLEHGTPMGEDEYLHTRFTLDGEEAEGHWENFQLDGYGTWLWALAQHTRLTGDVAFVREVARSVELTARYLSALWRAPSYDCWEENRDYVHPYTLAAAFAGLKAVHELQSLSGCLGEGMDPGAVVADIRQFILAQAVNDGHLVKMVLPQATAGNGALQPAVDASLMGAFTPYHLLAPDHPVTQATISRIEKDLWRPGGGVYRYLADTYYGGGEWLLLAAWLGWVLVEAEERDRALTLLRWVEEQADDNGYLPEQVSAQLLAPEYLPYWEAKWGPIAKPLLWSHAMYLILCEELGVKGAGS